MRRARCPILIKFSINGLVLALLMSSNSCGPMNHYFEKLEIDQNFYLLPVGSRSLAEPNSGSYFSSFIRALI